VFQTIKDVNLSLVDDNLVVFDKIGAGVFFWALPSMGYQSRHYLISNQENHIKDLVDSITKIETNIEAAKEARTAEGQEDRESLVAKYAKLNAEHDQVRADLKGFEIYDPEKLEAT
jgi:FtsZ-binding cell division protein ZapB